MPVAGKKATGKKATGKKPARVGGSVDRLVADFQKKFGDTVGGVGQDIKTPDRIATGVLQLDVSSGGGIPAGRTTIIWGDKDVGKSCLLYKLIATYQRENPDKVVVLMDIEGNYDSKFGLKFGINESHLMFLLPDTAEDACEMIVQLLKEASDQIGLIAVDSLAAMIPSKEVEGEMGDAHVGLQGRLVAQFCRKTNHWQNVARKEGHAPTIVLLNQVRTNIGQMRGDPSVMPGGKMVGHHTSTIIRLRGGKEKGDGEDARPYLKEVRGVIEKKKGPIVARNFEYVMAVEALGGMHVGEIAEDWKFAAAHLEDAGRLGKVDPSKPAKGWQIMGHEFKTLKECRAWYEDNRVECRSAIISHLFDHPEDVGTA